MRAEFMAIQTAFDHMPRITTTGSFDTIFAQSGNFTFILPGAPGTLATTANVATETARATAAEGTITTAVGTETTARIAGDATETSRATAAEALLAPKASPPLTGVPTAPTAAPGTNTTQLATTAFSAAAVLVETTARTSGDTTNATAITTEATARAAADAAEVTARNTAIGVETTRATAAEGTNATAITTETTRATAAEASNAAALTAFEGQFVQSVIANGYQEFPSGLIEQWGNSSTGVGAGVTVTFPLQFPTAAFSIQLTAVNAGGPPVAVLALTGVTRTNFGVNSATASTGATLNSVVFYWHAVGH